MSASAITNLIATLQELASRPLARATAMPPEVYTSADFLTLEQEKIFAKEWVCAGRSDSIAKPGDYLTYQIGDQPAFVMRTRDGGIRAFANVCLHRMMQLLEGKGNCKRIVCPYHAWTYDIDGRLLRTQHMERSAGFKAADYHLPEIRCEVWEGWIYLTLNADAKPVASKLKRLHGIVKRYHMADYVQVLQEDHEWDTNWKFLTENFMEGYHLPVAHRGTVGAYFPAKETRFSDKAPDDAFTFQWFIKTKAAPIGTAHRKNRYLKGEWRQTSVLVSVFPAHMYSLAPDHLWYLSLQPGATGKVKIRFGVAFAPEVLAEHGIDSAFVSDMTQFLSRVNDEDRNVVEGIFRGAKAGLSKPGPLSWLERENHEFTQYIARRLS